MNQTRATLEQHFPRQFNLHQVTLFGALDTFRQHVHNVCKCQKGFELLLCRLPLCFSANDSSFVILIPCRNNFVYASKKRPRKDKTNCVRIEFAPELVSINVKLVSGSEPAPIVQQKKRQLIAKFMRSFSDNLLWF